MARRRYSDADVAAALAALDANNGNVLDTAKKLNIPEPTLKSWAQGRGVTQSIRELHDIKKEELAAHLRDVAMKLIDAVPAKIENANLQQIGVVLGIAIEKAQLLAGEATERSEHNVILTDEQRTERVAQLLETARARRDGRAADPNDNRLQ